MEKIRDSKDKKCSDLKNIVFFVLSNNSIDKVREYSGDRIPGRGLPDAERISAV